MRESIVFGPELDERQLDRETRKVDDRLEGVASDIPVSFDPGELDGMEPPGVGGGGVDAGGVGAAAGVASRLPKPVAGVTAASALPVALAGGVGVGLLSVMGDASARLQTSANILGTAKKNFFREPGNVLDENIVRPLSEDILSLSTGFEDTASGEGGVGVAFGELFAGATITVGQGAFSWLADEIPDITADDFLGPVGKVGPDIVTGIINEIEGSDFSDFGDLNDELTDEVVDAWPGWPSIQSLWPGWPNVAALFPGWPDLDYDIPEFPGWPDVRSSWGGWPDVSELFPGWPDLEYSIPEFPGWPSIPQPDFDVEPPELPDNFWPEVSLPSDFWPDLKPDDVDFDIPVPDDLWPDLSVPTDFWPDISYPDNLWPDLSVPDNFWPDMAVPDIDIPRAELPDDFWPDVDAPDLDVPEFPGWPDLDYDIPEFPGWPDLDYDIPEFPGWGDYVPDLNWGDFIDSLNPLSVNSASTSTVPEADTGGLVEQTGTAIIHEGERIVPEAQVSDRGPAPVETTVNASMDTSKMEDKLDRLHTDLRQLRRAMDVTLEVDKETLGRATNDAKTNRMADTDPTV